MRIKRAEYNALIQQSQDLTKCREAGLLKDKQIADLTAQLAEQHPPPPPLPPNRKGVALPGGFQNQPADRRQQLLRMLRDAGVGWVRINVDPNYPAPALTVLAEIHAAGMKCLANVMFWTNDPLQGGRQVGRTPSPVEMAVKIRPIAADNFDAYEIGNEMNLASFSIGDPIKDSSGNLTGWTGPDPVKYAATYNTAKIEIKKVKPNAIVITGGLSPSDGTGSGGRDWTPTEFLNTAMAAGMQPDAIGWHPYCWAKSPQYPDGTLPSADLNWSAWYQMKKHPLYGKLPWWGTEFGSSTMGPRAVTQIRQAEIQTDGFRIWDGGGVLFVYMGQKHAPGTNSDEQIGYGIINWDWSVTPAYAALKATAA